VVAGPIEATALGNIMVQAIAKGEIASLTAGREMIKASENLKTFYPNVQYRCFLNLKKVYQN
jgi:rhamnulokinase